MQQTHLLQKIALYDEQIEEEEYYSEYASDQVLIASPEDDGRYIAVDLRVAAAA